MRPNFVLLRPGDPTGAACCGTGLACVEGGLGTCGCGRAPALPCVASHGAQVGDNRTFHKLLVNTDAVSPLEILRSQVVTTRTVLQKGRCHIRKGSLFVAFRGMFHTTPVDDHELNS